MSAWNVVADGVFQRRYQPMDVSVVAIVGGSGVTVVDTRNNPGEADEIIADVDRTFGLPIVAVVNTHAHYDHTFGNQRFTSVPGGGVPIYGHHLIPRHFERYEGPRLAAQQADPTTEPDKRWHDVQLTPPTEPIDRPTTVDAGGRTFELIPLAPGHTDTDLAVFVPDQRVWLLGDVVEESGPPMYGSGCFPFGWPDVLDGLLDMIEPGDRIVPGHGTVVDRNFVLEQATLVRDVASLIRSSWQDELSVDEALTRESGWPMPEWASRLALQQGYARLAAAATA